MVAVRKGRFATESLHVENEFVEPNPSKSNVRTKSGKGCGRSSTE